MSKYVISGHSMAETLTVALRVAEEAIEEAIAKAEEFSDSLVRCLFCSSSSFLLLTLSVSHFLHLLFPPIFCVPAWSVMPLSSCLALGLST